MKLKSTIFVFTALFFATFIQGFAQERSDVQSNLRAFAKLYGYVRFFHPSDEASKIDWDRFAVYGVGRIQDLKSRDKLISELKALFLPAAPSALIYKTGYKPKRDVNILPENADNLEFIAWRHVGVKLIEKQNIYNSRRVKSRMLSDLLKLPKFGESIETEIVPGVSCDIPLSLYINDAGATFGKNRKYPINTLLKKLEKINLPSRSADEQIIRLADVIITWNVMQHFYPYFDLIKANWNELLTETLADALNDKTANEFFGTLKRMIAKLEDGHGVVYFNPRPAPGGLPIRVEWIENKTVITATGDEAHFKKGDIIKTIDGVTGEEALIEAESFVSGSAQLKRFRALNQFGQGPTGSKAAIEIIRDGKTVRFDYARPAETRNMFFNKYSEFKFPGIKEIEDGVFYVNVTSASLETYEKKLNELAKAKGVIFDYRWDGAISGFSNKRISPHQHIIPHLVKENFKSARWNIPVSIYPDQKDVEFQKSNWNLPPRAPFFEGVSVWIVEPSVVSYGESCLGIIEHYKTSKIVGTKSAGCNGNANFIHLPGKFRIMWTGMKVLKHDGSQHHLVGISPTHPVEKTIKAVKEGRDLYLEKAIEVIKNAK